jgi:hypothetical protein
METDEKGKEMDASRVREEVINSIMAGLRPLSNTDKKKSSDMELFRKELISAIVDSDDSWDDRIDTLAKAFDQLKELKNMKAPIVNVEVRPAENKAPIVNVETKAPIINVEASKIDLKPSFNVPPSQVTVEASKCTSPKQWKFEIERNSEGFIKSMTAKAR